MFRKWISLLTTAIPLVSGAQNIDLLILNKNYPEALVQIVVLSPDDMNLISLYSKNKNAAEIMRVSEKALNIFPANPTLILRETNVLFSLSEYEKAKDPYESYLSKNDSVFDVLKNYGITLYFCKMYHHLGQVFGYSREFEKSIEALQKAFDYNNENVETLFEIATTYEEFKSDKNFALKAYSNYVKSAGD